MFGKTEQLKIMIMTRLLNYLLNKQCIFSIIMFFLSDGKKEKIHIARLKAEFMFFGYDATNMTDDEVKECIIQVAKAISSFGATTEESARAIHVLGN